MSNSEQLRYVSRSDLAAWIKAARVQALRDVVDILWPGGQINLNATFADHVVRRFEAWMDVETQGYGHA